MTESCARAEDCAAAASRVEKCKLIESELVGLVVDLEDLCPILAPIYLTVDVEEEIEFERDSLLLAVGAGAGTFMIVSTFVKASLRRHCVRHAW